MFSITSLPSLRGRVFLVTGGNTGIGYTTCLNLAAKGARVYMGARSLDKASQAITQIKQQHPQADLQILIMDHTSLATIVEAAKSFTSKESKLNGLILNAGINLKFLEDSPPFLLSLDVYSRCTHKTCIISS